MEKNLKKNIYDSVNHFVVHLKLTQHCKLTILQFKKWLKEQKITSVGKDVEKWNPCSVLVGM